MSQLCWGACFTSLFGWLRFGCPWGCGGGFNASNAQRLPLCLWVPAVARRHPPPAAALPPLLPPRQAMLAAGPIHWTLYLWGIW